MAKGLQLFHRGFVRRFRNLRVRQEPAGGVGVVQAQEPHRVDQPFLRRVVQTDGQSVYYQDRGLEPAAVVPAFFDVLQLLQGTFARQVREARRRRAGVTLDLQEELSALDTYKQASSALMGAEETPSETPAL